MDCIKIGFETNANEKQLRQSDYTGSSNSSKRIIYLTCALIRFFRFHRRDQLNSLKLYYISVKSGIARSGSYSTNYAFNVSFFEASLGFVPDAFCVSLSFSNELMHVIYGYRSFPRSFPLPLLGWQHLNPRAINARERKRENAVTCKRNQLDSSAVSNNQIESFAYLKGRTYNLRCLGNRR